MPKQNRDRSKSKIIRMPKLHEDTHAADVWFEAGMIYFEDPTNPEEVASCTVAHFENYLDNCLREFLEDEVMIRKFVCGADAAWKFYRDGKELVETAKRQLHVGLPIETISEIEMGRASISRRQGFGTPGLIAVPAAHTPAHAPAATPGAFTQRASGLIVPN